MQNKFWIDKKHLFKIYSHCHTAFQGNEHNQIETFTVRVRKHTDEWLCLVLLEEGEK